MSNAEYELRQRRKVKALAKKIKRIYHGSIDELVYKITALPYKGKPFSLADYPTIQKLVDQQLKKMHDGLYTLTVNGIEDSWQLANEKNDLLNDIRLAGRTVKPALKQLLYDPNKAALNSFIARKQQGMNLSDRVWKNLHGYRQELEQGLGIGLGKGQSANSLATDLKQYLNEPDKLFRRVRGEDGKLHLSKAARNYHPGQGVYRSSFKNSFRLTRTETNISLPLFRSFQMAKHAFHCRY